MWMYSLSIDAYTVYIYIQIYHHSYLIILEQHVYNVYTVFTIVNILHSYFFILL